MTKIDLKDRKILYELDLNCRQSNTQIGKKVGLQKNTVTYKIKRMEKEGIIKNYWTSINTFKLGYNVFRIYINFLDISKDMKNDMIRYFNNYKNIWALLSTKGPVDFDVVLWVKDTYDLNKFWNATLDRYGNYFEKYTISIMSQGICLKRSFLLLDDSDTSNREFYYTSCPGQSEKIDKIDYQILNEIALNARISMVDLAKKLDCSSQTIQNKIKNLIKKDIIQGFRVGIDVTKLGLMTSAIDIYLKDYSKRNQILEYVKTIPYVYDIMDMIIGWCDFNFQLVVKDIDHLNQIMDDINIKFPGAIRKMNFWLSLQVHKERWMPEMEF